MNSKINPKEILKVMTDSYKNFRKQTLIIGSLKFLLVVLFSLILTWFILTNNSVIFIILTSILLYNRLGDFIKEVIKFIIVRKEYKKQKNEMLWLIKLFEDITEIIEK